MAQKALTRVSQDSNRGAQMLLVPASLPPEPATQSSKFTSACTVCVCVSCSCRLMENTERIFSRINAYPASSVLKDR